VLLPDELALVPPGGEIHIKGAFVVGAPWIVFKVATGFPDNEVHGLAINDGFSVVLDAQTGAPTAILRDRGWLTELRTAAAGALAAELLSRSDASRAAIIGAGAQASWQLRALRAVRPIREVRVYNRTTERAERFVRNEEWSGLHLRVAETVEEAVAGADVIVTTTASRSPILEAAWVAPGTHITAMGSDFPSKQELGIGLLAAADRVVADAVAVCARVGELHHALVAGALAQDAAIELCDLVAGRSPGRTDPSQITIADLCGLGVYDAAVAQVVMDGLSSQR
jgi:ornithine cyclodeaminase